MRAGRGIAGVGAIVAAFLFAAAPAMGEADLSVSIAANSTSLALGGTETSEITLAVTNAGPDTAAAVSGVATVGAPQLTFTGFTGISQGSATFNPAGNPPISYNFGAIPAGATATVKWVENDAQSGVGTVSTSAITTTPESNTANNTASANIEVLALVPSATSLTFGAQTVGGIGLATPLTVTNKAAIPVQVSSAKLAEGDFVLSADSCTGTTLAAGASCQLGARFAPSAPGERAGSLTIASSTANVAPVAVGLAGTGVAAPVATRDVDPASLQLTGVPKAIDAKSFRKGFTVRVASNEPVALEVELSGKARPGALASALDLRLFGKSLPLAGGTRTIKVKPKPRLIGKIARKVKVQLDVTATDSSGNRSTVTRKIAVKPPRP